MHNFNKIDPQLKTSLFYQFSDKENGYKIKKKTSVTCNGTYYTLANSVIKIDNELYQIATGPSALIGQGSFGKVKYTQHLLSGKCYALKIEAFNPFSSDKKMKSEEASVNRENAINLDVNLSIAHAKRCHTLYKNKNYSVMNYMGQDLKEILENPLHYQLTDNIRFDIAIKLCFEIFKLHNGLLSNKSHKYTHQDIKPDNVSVAKKSNVSLIDFGLARINPNDTPTNIEGSPAYMPSLYELAKQSINFAQKDMLALKRTLYMPHIIKCPLGLKIDKNKHHFGLPFILPKSAVENKKLADYVDTGGQYSNAVNSKLSPLSLAAILILVSCNIDPKYYSNMESDQTLSAIIIGHYFSNHKNLKQQVLTAIDKYNYKKVNYLNNKRDSNMSPSEKLALLITYGVTNNINEAIINQKFINLLKSTASLEIKKIAVILFDLDILSLENSAIDILKDNQELLPIIHQLYNQNQQDKIIKVFFAPVNLSELMKKLKAANGTSAIFKISRNAAVLKALETSSSISYTKALLFLFNQNNKLETLEIGQLNGFKADAINFLICHGQHNLCNFAMQGNNSIIFHALETLVNSKLMPKADKIILPKLNILLKAQHYTNLIKDHPAPQKTCVIYHLFEHSISPNKLMLDKLFSSVSASNNLFNYLQSTYISLSLIRKITSDDKALNAFIFLSEKNHDLTYITTQLQSDIIIRQINDNLSLPPLPINPMSNQPCNIKAITSPTHHSKLTPLKGINNKEEPYPSISKTQPKVSVKPKSKLTALPPIHTKNRNENCVEMNRNRFFNPITHEPIERYGANLKKRAALPRAPFRY